MDKKVSISKGNIKLGSIPSISFPPVVTCAHCEECAKDCYALRLSKRYKNTREAWQNNLDIYNTTPELIEEAILKTALTTSYFRYFVGGDMPDGAFLLIAIRIAEQRPNCKFLMFTKKFEVVNAYLKSGVIIPNNLVIILSAWRGLEPVNPFRLPVSRVIFKDDFMPVNGYVCGGNCTECIGKYKGCFYLSNGSEVYFYKH